MTPPPAVLENHFITLKRARHGLFAFNRHDRFIGRSLDLYGEWAESGLDLLARFVKAGHTVLDVGANIGTHAVAFASMTTERGCVFAFEPQRLPFYLLCTNIALNGIVHVRCIQKAVGRKKGSINVPLLCQRETHNFGAVALGGGGGEEIDMLAIDELGLGACDLIKIDIEGMEAEALGGAASTIRQHRPTLYVECNTVTSAAATLAAIDALGYEAWWDISLYYNAANYFGNPHNAFAQYQPEANLLCLPRGRDPESAELIRCAGPGDDWKQALCRGIATSNPRFRHAGIA